MNSEFHSSGADRIGRFCALSHQRPELRETGEFIHDAQEETRRTARRLGELIAHCNGDGHFVAEVQENLLRNAETLPANMPEKLPFLPLPRPLGNRPRIVILMREWLLMAPQVGHERHLEEFLSAYQELFPLQLPEIRILPFAFRLALAERCQFLPSVAGNERDHVALLPVLLRRIHRHLEFAGRTDWKRLGENIGKVHLLLSRDPAGIYPRMDFLSRDAYRHEIEEIARQTNVSESSVASRAVALAERYRETQPHAAHVGYFLLGPGRNRLLGAFNPHAAKTSKHRFPNRKTVAASPQNLHPLRLDFSSGIPADFPTFFLHPIPAHDPARLDPALEILAATAENCRSSRDIQIGLLLTGIRHDRQRQPVLEKAKSALERIDANSRSNPIRLFLQPRADFPIPEAAQSGNVLWIPFHKSRPPDWFRQTAGFWRHPLNRPRIREIRPGAIRSVATEPTSRACASGSAR